MNNALTNLNFDGNINIGSGQLGLIKKVITSVVGSELLWNFANKYNTYTINSTNAIDVILPNIGNLSTDAKIGYRVNIKNVGSTILTLKNTLATAIIILNPNNHCTLYADDDVTQNWIVFYNSVVPSTASGVSIIDTTATNGNVNLKKFVSNDSSLSVLDLGNQINIQSNISGNITQSNLGAGTNVLSNPGTSNNFSYKSLLPGTGISLSNTANDITIDSTISGNITQSNLGVGNAVLSNPGTSNNFSYKSILPGTGISMSNTANDITINSTISGNITQSNLGAGTNVLSNPGTSNNFSYKSLLPGTGISLSNTANDITITSTGSATTVIPFILDTVQRVAPPSSTNFIYSTNTIPANTFSVAGISMRIHTGGTIVDTGANESWSTFLKINGAPLTLSWAGTVSNGTNIFTKEVRISLTSVLAGTGTFQLYQTVFAVANTTSVNYIFTAPLNAPIVITNLCTSGANSTTTQTYFQLYLE